MSNLEERTQSFIEANHLFTHTHKLLLAVSGGIDSVVLFHVLRKLQYQFIVAHCNFQLRGAESDADEIFVSNTAQALNIPFYVKKFDTLAFANEQKLSIQEAARKLRYNYFYELCQAEKCDFIVTAHNLDDRIETFFINLLRGTGLKGLCSIPVRNDRIVRPLLFCTRQEIIAYAKSNNIEWREDSSNSEDKYLRNKIRHHIIPSLIELKPAFYHVFIDNFERLNADKKVIDDLIEYEISGGLTFEKDRIIVDKHKIRHRKHLHSAFAYYLKQFGFTSKQAEILLTENLQTGKLLKSSTHQIIVDRNKWVIVPIVENNNEGESETLIYEDTTYLDKPLRLKLSTVSIKDLQGIPKSNFIACIDKQKLIFPLILRKWKKGDYMIPLGMKGKKKISDILTNAKVSTAERKNVYVIESNNEIVWLAGIRLNEKYKLTNETQEVFVIELIRDGRVDDRHDRGYKPY